MHPIVADGGEITVLRSLTSHAYGKWDVTWPDSVPEQNKPTLEDDRDFAYSSQLVGVSGRMARRFVRSDIPVQAAEYSESGEIIPYTGYSGAEATLDAAAKRTTGDVFFEREFTREHLGGLEPWVDFTVGSLIPVEIWGKTLMVVVTHIEAVTQMGAVIDWRVRVGDSLIRDDEARERNVRQMERDLAQEIRERQKEVRETRAEATALVSAEAEQRARDLLAEREAWTNADKKLGEEIDKNFVKSVDLAEKMKPMLKEMKDLSDEIAPLNSFLTLDKQQKINEAVKSYQALNTAMWDEQGQFNQLQTEFQATQKLINDEQKGINALNKKFQEEQEQRAIDQRKIDSDQHLQTQMIERRTPLIFTFREAFENDFFKCDISGNEMVMTKKPGWTGTVAVQLNFKALNNFSSAASARFSMQGSSTWRFAAGTFESLSSGLIILIRD